MGDLSGGSLQVEAQTVAEVQAQVESKEAVPAGEQRLNFAGRSLAPAELLSGSTVSRRTPPSSSTSSCPAAARSARRRHTPAQEDQAQAQKGETCSAQVLQGGLERQGDPLASRVPVRDVRSWCLYGHALQPLLLRQVPPDLSDQEGGQVSDRSRSRTTAVAVVRQK